MHFTAHLDFGEIVQPSLSSGNMAGGQIWRNIYIYHVFCPGQVECKFNQFVNTNFTGLACRDQTKGRKTLFLPKIISEISAETLSVLNLLSAYLQKEPLSAERFSFGRVDIFWQSNATLLYGLRTFNLFQNGIVPCRKTLLLQKGSTRISTERVYFGRRRHYWQNIGFSRNSQF